VDLSVPVPLPPERRKEDESEAAIVARSVAMSLPEFGGAAGVVVAGDLVATPTMLGGTRASGMARLLVATPGPDTTCALAMATAAGGGAVDVDEEAAAGAGVGAAGLGPGVF
jgi:hypothetical protein